MLLLLVLVNVFSFLYIGAVPPLFDDKQTEAALSEIWWHITEHFCDQSNAT